MSLSKQTKHHVMSALALLAMAVSFMAQITPLWLSQQTGTELTICTAYGIETITIDENGDRLPNKPEQTNAQKHCAFCLSSTLQVTLPRLENLKDRPPVTALLKAPLFYHAELHRHAHGDKAHGIRAPPVKS